MVNTVLIFLFCQALDTRLVSTGPGRPDFKKIPLHQHLLDAAVFLLVFTEPGSGSRRDHDLFPVCTPDVLEEFDQFGIALRIVLPFIHAQCSLINKPVIVHFVFDLVRPVRGRNVYRRRQLLDESTRR